MSDQPISLSRADRRKFEKAMRRAYSLGRQAGAHRAREEIRNALGVKS